MKKIISIILFVCITIATVGCGKDNNNKTNSSTDIRIVIESEDGETYGKMFSEFEELYKEKGYKVIVTTVGGGQVYSKQENMMIQGMPPDVIVGGDVHIMNQHKYLLPLDDLISRDSEEVKADDFIDQVFNACKKDGKTLYLPNFFNSSLLYYNVDLFDSYNEKNEVKIDYPKKEWTYEDFISAAKKLTYGTNGNISQWGCYSTIGWWGEWLIHVRQHGGDLMDENT